MTQYPTVDRLVIGKADSSLDILICGEYSYGCALYTADGIDIAQMDAGASLRIEDGELVIYPYNGKIYPNNEKEKK